MWPPALFWPRSKILKGNPVGMAPEEVPDLKRAAGTTHGMDKGEGKGKGRKENKREALPERWGVERDKTNWKIIRARITWKGPSG